MHLNMVAVGIQSNSAFNMSEKQCKEASLFCLHIVLLRTSILNARTYPV